MAAVGLVELALAIRGRSVLDDLGEVVIDHSPLPLIELGVQLMGTTDKPLLRLQSHYFALATLALASIVNLVAVHAETLTGGANGLAGFTPGLPRGPLLLAVVWACLIVLVLRQP